MTAHTLTQDEYLVNHQQAPSTPYQAYQPLQRHTSNPSQPIYVPSGMTTYQMPQAQQQQYQQQQQPINAQMFEDPSKGTYTQPPSTAPPPYQASSLGNTAYTQDEMMFHSTPQPQYRNVQPGLYPTMTIAQPTTSTSSSAPLYTTGTQPSYAPPTYTQQPSIMNGASAVCGRCGAGYPLPPGSTSWRCKTCSMLNTTTGNQCVMF